MRKNENGILIIFEGIDKCGKSTQLQRLAGCLLGRGYSVLEVKEPPFPDEKLGIPDVRQEIMRLDKTDPELREKELVLFERIRKKLHKKVILPALKNGLIVLSDRGQDSTTTFQGYGRGMDLEKIREANKKAVFGRYADLTILFDIEPAVAMKRVTKEDQVNRFEQELLDFHQRVKMGYLQEALYDATHRIKLWQIIWADDDKNVITMKILDAVNKHLGL